MPAPTGYNDAAATGSGRRPTSTSAPTCAAHPATGCSSAATEPECDPLEWVEDPDASNPNPTPGGLRGAGDARGPPVPRPRVPGKPVGIAGVYDVTEDWTPIYDGTEREGFFVAIGTSGNQFKNAPVVGQIMAALITGETTARRRAHRPGDRPDGFSRHRPRNADSTGTVMG